MQDAPGPQNQLSDVAEWEEKLNEFCLAMKNQIMINWHKGGRDHWLGLDTHLEVTSVKISAEELATAVLFGVDVLDKAADTAVWSFFVWDTLTHGNRD